MWWIELGVLLTTTTTAAAARLHRRLPDRAQRMVAQSTVEYALVGALVVIAAAGALTILGGQLNTVFTSISNTLKTASAGR
jgi:Flp pilus assembly pilin Flp